MPYNSLTAYWNQNTLQQANRTVLSPGIHLLLNKTFISKFDPSHKNLKVDPILAQCTDTSLAN